MPLKSSPEHWGTLTKFFHWTIAVLVIATMVLGSWMTELAPSADKMRWYALHKSIGLSILLLMLLRLLWRRFDQRPRPAPGLGPIASRVSRTVHASFYLLLIAMPISGWLYNSAANFPLRWFGWVHVPALVGADPMLKKIALSVHETLFWVILGLLVLHVAGALKHHFMDRDNSLRRMLPFGKGE
ncbi:MAG: cytochrome B [Lysobacterales bacterium CG02_land_8_20_14_3_00_62_12]|nr:MAG: cytochrome B [Xanthomonadales bacterium CG02_land_8_20_14_3_00_62_12]PJA40053.1 MAG: cytochrome B [Xanthomonadales bacterium CG_4_9_14_3_um_filter_62_6]